LSSRAPIGWSLINTLLSRASQVENIHILTGVVVDELLLEDSADAPKCVTGVRYHNVSMPSEAFVLPAGAVIITTGGSAFDQSDDGLLNEYAPHLRGMATSSGPQADGSGIKLARAVCLILMSRSHHLRSALNW
jgi:succinate dehydrogenase/fumarate reductase flavoprotein subunit